MKAHIPSYPIFVPIHLLAGNIANGTLSKVTVDNLDKILQDHQVAINKSQVEIWGLIL